MGNPRKRKLRKLVRMKKRNTPVMASPAPVTIATPAPVVEPEPVIEKAPVIAKSISAPKRAISSRKTTKTVKIND